LKKFDKNWDKKVFSPKKNVKKMKILGQNLLNIKNM